MQVTTWPNNLGFDVASRPEVDIWKHKDGFRVFTETKCLKVPYSVTTNPATALQITDEHGLSRSALDDMDPREAEVLYQTTAPMQRELFG